MSGNGPPAQPSPTITSALAKFLSGDKGQLLIMGLVVLSGGGNLLTTSTSSRVNQDEVQRAVTEIHNLHDALAPIMDRQKQGMNDIAAIKKKLGIEDPK